MRRKVNKFFYTKLKVKQKQRLIVKNCFNDQNKHN